MRSIDATDLCALLRPGMRVWVAGSSNEPRALVDVLAQGCDREAHASGVTFLQFPLPGLNRFDFSSLHEQARQLTFFLTPDLRSGYDDGRVQYLPMHMRHIYDYLAAGPLDLALIQCARDAHGVLRAGPNVDFHAAALGAAKVVVAELNSTLPAPAGAPVIDESAIDYCVESENGPLELPSATPDAVARAIGAHVASLIRDGDCIQTGIGAIPAAILAALVTKNDIGLHGGLLDDGGRVLIEAGVATGAAKTHMQGKHVTGMLVGSSQLFEWAACRDDVVLVGANVTHESRTIALIDNFVSINSAVEVDLDGQVNAEVVAGRQISGVGGAVDFMRAARMSRGGRSIVAMTSTAAKGKVSRIVPRVSAVTALRTDVDIVVTEYGIAKLHGLTQEARGGALTAIAHPDFRDELRSATRRYGGGRAAMSAPPGPKSAWLNVDPQE